MGLGEALILLYLLVDDAYRIVTLGGRLRQRGADPKLSDVEVLTMEIFGEQQGCHHDAAIHRYVAGHGGPSFRSRILPSLRPAVRGVVADQAADPGPRVSGPRHPSYSRRLSDLGLSRLPRQPVPDLAGRSGLGLLREQEGAFLRLARPPGHRSGGPGASLPGDRGQCR